MAEVIELDPVDHLAAGAIGVPGSRQFLVQARRGGVELTVLMEKEQVALLAAESTAFLDRVAEEYPEPKPEDSAMGINAELSEPGEPLFRVQLIGLGFDPARDLVLIELRERSPRDAEEIGGEDDEDEDEGFLARLFATRAQVRAMAMRSVGVVAAGRPRCTLCDFPMDPAGHICPRWN
jgi:uncharacterized repeat protein (TIGR03847 family)